MKVVSIPRDYTEMRPLTGQYNPNRKIALPTMEGITFERVNQIISLEARGNYSMIHFRNGRPQLVCKTLREMEAMLNRKRQFIRIHRSHTINLDHLEKYVRGKSGYVIMEDGRDLIVSGGKRQEFLEALQRYFS